jgi:hypothetical protein
MYSKGPPEKVRNRSTHGGVEPWGTFRMQLFRNVIRTDTDIAVRPWHFILWREKACLRLGKRQQAAALQTVTVFD